MHSSPSPRAPSTLVGRDRELGVLREHLDAAMAGQGSLVLIGGEAGIGKTALAEATVREAKRAGVTVLQGHCFDLAETPPYGPWIDLFARFAPPASAPVLPDAFARRGTVGAVPSQMALFVQVQDFLVALGQPKPVALLLDDLHWADPASLDLLRFLSRSVATLPLLILATYRSDELTRRHPLYQLLPQLAREAGAVRIDLSRLDDAAIGTLLQGRYGLPDDTARRLVTYLQTRAEGNALFVGELLRSLEESGTMRRTEAGWALDALEQTAVPRLLRQVIDGRVSRLGGEAQRALSVASVIGHEVSLAVWATVAEAGDAALLAIAEQGLESHLLVEAAGGERVRFAHALIRETLYEGVPGIRRRRLHRRAAEALAAAPRPDPDTVADHFQRAEDERALPWLLQAGERAQAAYAWTTAAARFEAALALMERTDADAGERGWLLLRLARLLRFSDVAKARVFADEAAAVAAAVTDRALAAYTRFHRGFLASLAGDVAYGLPEIEAGADALAALSDGERAHFTAHAAAIDAAGGVAGGRDMVVVWRANAGRFRAARELGERIVAEAAGGDEEALQSDKNPFIGLGDAYAALGMPDEAAAMHTLAHDVFLRAGHHFLAARALSRELELVALPYRTEDIAGRRRLAERAAAAAARASGTLSATFPARFLCLPLLMLEGRWEEAERLALAGSTEAEILGYWTNALGHLGALARLRGEAGRAWRAVRDALPAGSATEPGTVTTFLAATALQREAVALALDGGDLPLAHEWLAAHDHWLEWSGAVLGRSEGRALRAQYHRQAGNTDKARDHAERALTHATDPRQPLALLAAHRLLGELDAESGRYADAETHVRESLSLATACEAPYERALTLLAMAELGAVTGRSDDARQLLNEVRIICTPLDAKPALARADALEARLAATPAAAPSYPAGLSAREAEVLQLIAHGLTNRQVAERLFLSPRTVEQHLRSIYNKLGVATRAAATHFAVTHDLA
jgi:DNA-binding CsgD family transcriptional regulator